VRKLFAALGIVLALLLGATAWWLVEDAEDSEVPTPAPLDELTDGQAAESETARKRSRASAEAEKRVIPGPATTDTSAGEPAREKDQVIEILVIDALGEPCGDVLVHLSRCYQDGFWMSSLHATDEATGIATLPVLNRGDASEESEDDVVTLAVPVNPRPSVRIDPTTPTDEPVRLQLPPTGSVVLEFVDVEWRPVTGISEPLLRLAKDDNGLVSSIDSANLADTFVSGDSETALFPHVGLGLELVAIVAGRSDTELSARQTFTGPTDAGEEVRIRLVVGRQRPVVTGRLVTPDGTPVTEARLFGDVLPETGELWRDRHDGWATTDESGRFRFALDVAPERARGRMLRIGREIDGANGHMERSEVVTRELPGAFGSGELDLGDLVSSAGILLVSGVVLDESGHPVKGAEITATHPTERGPRRMSDVGKAVTDAAGHFLLRGPPEGDRVSIAVETGGLWLDDPPIVAVGATDVQVRMKTAGGLAGSLAPLPGLNTDSLRLLVVGEPASNGEYNWSESRLAIHLEDGAFARTNLRPGMASVSIRTGWRDETTIATIDDVRIVAGETNRDPRLQQIDLSAVLRPIRIDITDEKGERVRHAAAHHRPAVSASEGDRDWTEVTQTESGVTTILSTAPQSEVVILAPGFLSVTRVLSAGEFDVQLKPAKQTEIEIALRSTGPFPKSPHYVSAELLYVGPPGSTRPDGSGDWTDDPRSIDPWEANFDADRKVKITAWEPGRYQVQLVVWLSTVDGATGSHVDTDPEHAVVEVGPDGAPVRIEVGFDAESYELIMKDG